jgi:hypothetical protein
MLRCQPIPLGSALTLPKHRRLERMVLTERGVQLAALAIWELVSGSLLYIMSRISSSCHNSSFGAMLCTTGESIMERCPPEGETGMARDIEEVINHWLPRSLFAMFPLYASRFHGFP